MDSWAETLVDPSWRANPRVLLPLVIQHGGVPHCLRRHLWTSLLGCTVVEATQPDLTSTQHEFSQSRHVDWYLNALGIQSQTPDAQLQFRRFFARLAVPNSAPVSYDNISSPTNIARHHAQRQSPPSEVTPTNKSKRSAPESLVSPVSPLETFVPSVVAVVSSDTTAHTFAMASIASAIRHHFDEESSLSIAGALGEKFDWSHGSCLSTKTSDSGNSELVSPHIDALVLDALLADRFPTMFAHICKHRIHIPLRAALMDACRCLFTFCAPSASSELPSSRKLSLAAIDLLLVDGQAALIRIALAFCILNQDAIMKCTDIDAISSLLNEVLCPSPMSDSECRCASDEVCRESCVPSVQTINFVGFLGATYGRGAQFDQCPAACCSCLVSLSTLSTPTASLPCTCAWTRTLIRTAYDDARLFGIDQNLIQTLRTAAADRWKKDSDTRRKRKSRLDSLLQNVRMSASSIMLKMTEMIQNGSQLVPTTDTLLKLQCAMLDLTSTHQDVLRGVHLLDSKVFRHYNIVSPLTIDLFHRASPLIPSELVPAASRVMLPPLANGSAPVDQLVVILPTPAFTPPPLSILDCIDLAAPLVSLFPLLQSLLNCAWQANSACWLFLSRTANASRSSSNWGLAMFGDLPSVRAHSESFETLFPCARDLCSLGESMVMMCDELGLPLCSRSSSNGKNQSPFDHADSNAATLTVSRVKASLSSSLNYAAPFVSTNIYSFAATSSSEATTRSAIAAAAAAKGAARSRESQSAVIAPVQKSSAAASGSTSIHSDVLGQLSAQRPSLFVSLSISNSLNASETANLFVGIDFGYSLKALQHDLLDLQHESTNLTRHLKQASSQAALPSAPFAHRSSDVGGQPPALTRSSSAPSLSALSPPPSPVVEESSAIRSIEYPDLASPFSFMPSTGQERSVDVIRSHVLTPLNVNMQREAELHSLESAIADI